MKFYGWIGGGNMGGTLAAAAARVAGGEHILLADKDDETTAARAAALGVTPSNYAEIAARCGMIFLGVKPNLVGLVAKSLATLPAETVVVSMAAGVTLETLASHFGAQAKIIRIMPNTPAAVGRGMMVYAHSPAVTEQEIADFCRIMADAGILAPIAEDKIDAATAVMGCGPAYVYLFIEALADGGVACGLSREQAQLFAAQTLAGAAEMVLSTGKHPGELKDAVCSPGGSTIAGVAALENGGLRATAIAAVKAAYDRTQELGK